LLFHFFCRFHKDEYSFTLQENTTTGTSIGQVLASDSDVTFLFSHVYYDLKTPNETFKIDQSSGLITLNQTVDFETKQLYNLKAVAFNIDAFGNRTMLTQVDVRISWVLFAWKVVCLLRSF